MSPGWFFLSLVLSWADFAQGKGEGMAVADLVKARTFFVYNVDRKCHILAYKLDPEVQREMVGIKDLRGA